MNMYITNMIHFLDPEFFSTKIMPFVEIPLFFFFFSLIGFAIVIYAV